MQVNRRQVLAGGLATVGLSLPRWSWGVTPPRTSYDLTLAEERIPVAGKRQRALTINGTAPGPVLHLKEGTEAVLRVHNRMRERSSIHWHGLLLPPDMDGVPGVSFAGIEPGETYEYRFGVRQAGTYWYHSHSGTQEQLGIIGGIVIEPREPGGPSDTAGPVDREHVIVLTDWPSMDPDRIMATLKKSSGYFNFQKRTVVDALTGRDGKPLKRTLAWGRMRMDPTDISDVTGSTYTYLVNGRDELENWTGAFKPGERVRLRFINASAMTAFDVRIPGLPMQVVGTDGQPVVPVEVDEFRITVAETYDVVVEPAKEAYTIFCETMDRSGFARATLALREGMSAPIPEMRTRPLLTMDDMAMAMDGMKGQDMSGMKGQDIGGMKGHDMDGMKGHDMDGMKSHDMGGMKGSIPSDMKSATYVQRSAAKGVEPADLASLPPVKLHSDDHHGPGNIAIAQRPRIRVDQRGNGLEEASWRVLVPADLMSPIDQPDPRSPSREIEIHLTGHMERYIWSFNGKKFADDPFIHLDYNERVRITYINDTMMLHPIHLHGMFVELENGRGRRAPLKHTVPVGPGEQLSVLLTANEAGDWAYHCHLLYHMDMGMFRVVRVAQPTIARTP